MRYEFLPEDPMEEAAFRSNPAARALLDPFLPVIQARAIMAAVETGVFEALGDEAKRADDLAQSLSLDQDVLTMLLRVLSGAGYVSFDGRLYSLTGLSRSAFLADSPSRLSYWVKFNYMQWEVIGGMEHALRTGKGIDTGPLLKSREDWEIQQQAMLETARPAAPWVGEKVPIRDGASRLLDLGGSHGLYGAMICRKHPPLKSTVLDVPDAIEPARELARREGIDDVVDFLAGDALADDLGRECFDAAFLGNLVHHLSEERNRELLARLIACLKPRGTVAIWDIRYPEAGSRPDLFSDGFALYFRIASSARCYRHGEIVAWLESAGFTEIDIHQVPGPTHFLITGRKR